MTLGALQSMVFLHGGGFLDSFCAKPKCPLGNEQRQNLTPTLQGPEGGAARKNVPSQHLANVTPPTSCVSAQPDQGASWQSKECPKGRHLAESMPCCSESWGEGAGLILLLGSYKNKYALPAPGSSQTWPRSCWLLQL